jgi:hypothetical protein
VGVPMRVLVCGSRTWTAGEVVYVMLSGLWKLHAEESFDDWPPDPFVVISGGAKGADTFAAEWAEGQPGAQLEVYRAQWGFHGKGAGPIRNQKMLEEGKPNLVLAFSHFPTTTGTADMIGRAKKVGITVWQVGNP